MSARLAWAPSPAFIRARLARLTAGLQRESARTLTGLEGELQAQMKAGAPWADISGATRAGLFAEASPAGVGGEIVISMGGGGGDPWLEVRRLARARRPIIRPTLETAGPRVLAGFDGLIGRAL